MDESGREKPARSIHLALTHRPRELRDKGRWLVARVTQRIVIEAEESALRGGK